MPLARTVRLHPASIRGGIVDRSGGRRGGAAAVATAASVRRGCVGTGSVLLGRVDTTGGLATDAAVGDAITASGRLSPRRVGRSRRCLVGVLGSSGARLERPWLWRHATRRPRWRPPSGRDSARAASRQSSRRPHRPWRRERHARGTGGRCRRVTVARLARREEIRHQGGGPVLKAGPQTNQSQARPGGRAGGVSPRPPRWHPWPPFCGGLPPGHNSCVAVVWPPVTCAVPAKPWFATTPRSAVFLVGPLVEER